MKRASLSLILALSCLPVAAHAQLSTLPAPTDAERTKAAQLIQQCRTANEMGVSDPVSCYGQYANAGLDGFKTGHWPEIITDESNAITIFTVYQQRFTGMNTPEAPDLLIIPYLARSTAYGKTGQYNLALADDETALALKPLSAAAWNQRCWDRAHTGQLADAVQDCNKSLSIAPHAAGTLDSLGYTYLQMKNYPAAQKSYEAALKIQPDTASCLYGLALAQQAQGDKASADQNIAAAQKLDPHIATSFGT